MPLTKTNKGKSMEAEERMIIRDLPVSTRNYSIVDNITGKPIEQSTYSLTIDPEIISKLNKLKRVSEEKVKQASLREQYSSQTLVSTFTPEDHSVFTPVYSDEYIDAEDFVISRGEIEEEKENKKQQTNQKDEFFSTTEVVKSNTLLDRVFARDPSTIPEVEESVEEQPEVELDYITADRLEGENMRPSEVNEDNSLFTSEMVGLKQASEQIININTNKLGREIKAVKEQKRGTEKIKLDRMEVRAGKNIAWLAYLLFFIPLLINRRNRFVRLHANEGLELNIMEALSALLIVPFFIFKDLAGTAQTIVTCCALLGFVILCACLLTIIPMIIFSLAGSTFQIPWLWKKRIIHVSTERE